MEADFKGITAEQKELGEGEYFCQAKLLVLENALKILGLIRGGRCGLAGIMVLFSF